MPSTITSDCPHCAATKGGFAIAAHSFVQDTNYLLAHCQDCWMPIVAEMSAPNGYQGPMPDPRSIPPSYNGWSILRFWPELPAPNMPEYLPDQVARAFRQAEATFAQKHMEETSAGAYGRALDIATKMIVPEFKGPLFARIQHLADTGKITPDLATWAHDIRVIRNGALHEVEGITRKDLTHIRGLADMVLRYLFTLPGMLEARKDEARKAKG